MDSMQLQINSLEVDNLKLRCDLGQLQEQLALVKQDRARLMAAQQVLYQQLLEGTQEAEAEQPATSGSHHQLSASIMITEKNTRFPRKPASSERHWTVSPCLSQEGEGLQSVRAARRTSVESKKSNRTVMEEGKTRAWEHESSLSRDDVSEEKMLQPSSWGSEDTL